MFELLNLNGWLILLILAGTIGLYKLVGFGMAKFLRERGVASSNLRQLICMITAVVYNIIILELLGFNVLEMVQLVKVDLGIFWTIVGTIYGGLMAYLTYQVIVQGHHGQRYSQELGEVTPRDRFYVVLSLLVFVGPAEDLFFLGVIMTTLLGKVGSWAIPLYLVIFTFYHYLNVVQGVESKREFLNMLPFRFVIAAILAATYSRTGTLLYSMIIHNIFDSLNYQGLLAGVKAKVASHQKQGLHR